MALPAKRIPQEGEVWASPCLFKWASTWNGSKTLKVCLPKMIDGKPSWDVGGYEVRTVVAVVDLPGHYQRRVFFKRQFSPDGHKTIYRKALYCVSLSSFNSWLKGATLMEPGIVEKAVKILEAA